MSDLDRPDIFDDTANSSIWSRASVGRMRLTWRELAEHQEIELRRLRRMAQTLTDLDRCEHGRHEGDVCGGVTGCNGQSRGNPIASAHERQIGYTISGKPILVPRRGEKWEGE